MSDELFTPAAEPVDPVQQARDALGDWPATPAHVRAFLDLGAVVRAAIRDYSRDEPPRPVPSHIVFGGRRKVAFPVGATP